MQDRFPSCVQTQVRGRMAAAVLGSPRLWHHRHQKLHHASHASSCAEAIFLIGTEFADAGPAGDVGAAAADDAVGSTGALPKVFCGTTPLKMQLIKS